MLAELKALKTPPVDGATVPAMSHASKEYNWQGIVEVALPASCEDLSAEDLERVYDQLNGLFDKAVDGFPSIVAEALGDGFEVQ